MFIQRPVLDELVGHKENRKITIVTGARQVGKTTLLRKLYDTFKQDHPCLFLDLDIYSQYETVSTYENCINTLKLNGWQETANKLFVLFLDEFQRYPDVSRVLKNLSDHHPNVKVYASGSSSLAINQQIQESLAGRKRTVPVHPLSFKEYLRFIRRDDLIRQLHNLKDVRSGDLLSLMPDAFKELERFMIFGGYPEVVLTDDREKKEVLASIFDLYVRKDLIDFLRIEKIKHAKTLIQHLAVNHGQETRFNQLALVAGIDDKTTANYIEILKETYLISVHSPWYTNKNKELVKMPKIYFCDNGVRNYFLNNFNFSPIRQDMPFLFEGFVFSELTKMGYLQQSLKFWRTRNKQEVDLILEHAGGVRPMEIKYKRKLSAADKKGLDAFRAMYPDSLKPYIINLGSNASRDPEIDHISPFELDCIEAL